MKDLLLKLLLGTVLSGLMSCTNELNEVTEKKVALTLNNVEVINGGQLLKFKDDNAYDEALQKISAMTTEERVKYFKSLSFRSQMIFMEEANDELVDICESTDVLSVAEKRYSQFKQKYSNIFMFNDSDTSDRSPYSKLICSTHSFFSNEKGEFMIGDSLVKSAEFLSFNEYEQQTQPIMTRDVTTNDAVNDAHSYKSDRRVRLRLYIGGEYIHANFIAQKKTWFGWVKYSTVYHAYFYISGGGFEFAEGALLGSLVPFVNKDGIPFAIDTKELKGDFSTIFGRKRNGGTCVGNMEIWSRGIIYSDRGFSSIKL